MNTIDSFYTEAMRLAKALGKIPDLRCMSQPGKAAYRRRVKVQKWLKDSARLAHLFRAIDDYVRHHGAPNDPALPTRWKPRKHSPVKHKRSKKKVTHGVDGGFQSDVTWAD